MRPPDDDVINVGEWSEPVSDGDGHTLRGGWSFAMIARPRSNHARVYLELEHGGSGTLQRRCTLTSTATRR